jgi:hypothetical protein
MTKSVPLGQVRAYFRGINQGQARSGPNSELQGVFFDFSLTTLHVLQRADHPARSAKSRCATTGTTTSFRNCNQPVPCRCQGRSLRSRCGAKRSSFDRDFRGIGYEVSVLTGENESADEDASSTPLVEHHLNTIGTFHSW